MTWLRTKTGTKQSYKADSRGVSTGSRLDSLADHQNNIDALSYAPGGVSSDFDDPLKDKRELSATDVRKLLPDY